MPAPGTITYTVRRYDWLDRLVAVFPQSSDAPTLADMLMVEMGEGFSHIVDHANGLHSYTRQQRLNEVGDAAFRAELVAALERQPKP